MSGGLRTALFRLGLTALPAATAGGRLQLACCGQRFAADGCTAWPESCMRASERACVAMLSQQSLLSGHMQVRCRPGQEV